MSKLKSQIPHPQMPHTHKKKKREDGVLWNVGDVGTEEEDMPHESAKVLKQTLMGKEAMLLCCSVVKKSEIITVGKKNQQNQTSVCNHKHKLHINTKYLASLSQKQWNSWD